MSETPEEPVADAAGEDPKSEVKSGDEAMPSNPKSVGWFKLQKVQLDSWDAENEEYWEAEGKHIATRNLWASIPNLFCGFGVWLVWSVITSKIQLVHDKDPDVYAFPDWGSPQGNSYRVVLYLLPSVAGLSGGTLRLPNSFMTQCSGGRNVVYQTSLLLALPMLITGIALKNPDVSFSLLLSCSLLSGVGGGAFASSMSNISFFYPRKSQGYCLGMNGGLGNLGVSMSQLLAPVFMSNGFGEPSVSAVQGAWIYNAGWFWFCICIPSAALAFFWMNNIPEHGEPTWWLNFKNFWSMEIVGIVAAVLAMITLIFTHSDPAFSGAGGKAGLTVLLVLIAAIVEHVFIWFLTPEPAKSRVRGQAVIFKEKHNYIMTFLYVMCFGSFIGYSSAFPKLIVDLFGYIKDENGQEITNPNAPNAFSYSWLGAFIGSIIRPVGGILADKCGGAKITMIAIVICTGAAIAQGFVVQITYGLDNPESMFGPFLFLFLVLFACTGIMNGSTFGTIGVLFEPDIAGPVLGWSSAIASFGAFVIPAFFGVAMSADSPQWAFWGLSIYYGACMVINFWYYIRPGCEKPGV